MYYRAEAQWNIFSHKPHLTPQYNAAMIAAGDDLADVTRQAKRKIAGRLSPDKLVIYEYESRNSERIGRVIEC